MVGRRPKPVAVKELAGNPGRRRLPKSAAARRAKALPCPQWMGEYGRKVWVELSPILDRLGILTEVDICGFEALCATYDRFRVAAEFVRQNGMVYDHGGVRRMHPEVRIQQDALRELRQLMAEFGVTPAARSRVAAAIDAQGKSALSVAGESDMSHAVVAADDLTDLDYFPLTMQ